MRSCNLSRRWGRCKNICLHRVLSNSKEKITYAPRSVPALCQYSVCFWFQLRQVRLNFEKILCSDSLSYGKTIWTNSEKTQFNLYQGSILAFFSSWILWIFLEVQKVLILSSEHTKRSKPKKLVPFEWLDGVEKLSLQSLPEYNEFFNQLRNCNQLKKIFLKLSIPNDC